MRLIVSGSISNEEQHRKTGAARRRAFFMNRGRSF